RALDRMQEVEVAPQGLVGRVFHKAFAKSRNRNAEGNVAVLQLRREVWLLQCAPVRRVDAPGNGEQIVHSAVRRAVRVEDKARFPDRPVGREEGGEEVGGPGGVGNADLRIRAWTASADRRLGVAKKTAVAIERRAQTCQWLAAQGSPDGNCLAKKRQ